MAGSKNDVLVGKNADFSQAGAPNATSGEANGLQTNGQMWIGTTALNAGGSHINVGTITSPSGTLTVGYSSPNITLDLAGGSLGIDSIGVDATSGGGTNPVLPTAAGLVTVNGAVVAAGTNPIRSVSTAANVYQIQVQTSQALAATDATKIGLCNFDSADFAVDANGFVTLAGVVATSYTADTGSATPAANNLNVLGGTNCTTTGSGSTITVDVQGIGTTWVEVTGTSVSAAVNTGYILNNVALVTVNLPGTCAVGDEIRLAGKGAGLWVADAPAGDTIHFGNQDTSSGGTITATNRYDCIHLLCTVANSEWTVLNSIGNLTIA